MRTLSISCLLVAAVCSSLHGQEQFQVYGTDHMDVNSEYEGGSLYDSSTATLLPGGSAQWVYVNWFSSLTVAGGSVQWITAFDSGHINFQSGSASIINALDHSTATISGGSVGLLRAEGANNIVVTGWDFQLAGGLSWAPDNETLLGTGLLSGKWLGQNDVWTMSIPSHSLGATIKAVPEPASLSMLLAAGGVSLVRIRRRNPRS